MCIVYPTNIVMSMLVQFYTAQRKCSNLILPKISRNFLPLFYFYIAKRTPPAIFSTFLRRFCNLSCIFLSFSAILGTFLLSNRIFLLVFDFHMQFLPSISFFRLRIRKNLHFPEISEKCNFCYNLIPSPSVRADPASGAFSAIPDTAASTLPHRH